MDNPTLCDTVDGADRGNDRNRCVFGMRIGRVFGLLQKCFNLRLGGLIAESALLRTLDILDY